MWGHLLDGLTSLDGAEAVSYLVGGAILGTLIGVMPGLSTAVILSIILTFSYHINLVGTLCLFLGAHAGSYYSGSITAILINAPAHPEALAITYDGYPMARRGEAGRALGLSAASTCIGGIIGCVVCVPFIPLINNLAGVIKPADYVALVLLAIVLVGTLGASSVPKAIGSAGAGLLAASVGPSLITGEFRYTYGSIDLGEGVSLVALALGVFTVPQMVGVFAERAIPGYRPLRSRSRPRADARRLGGGIWETFRYPGTLLQGGGIGAISGMVPGIGAFTGNLMSYGVARALSRKRDQFGTGIAQGIIAPESSSLAKEAGHIIPILGLGIPGGVGGALFLAALSIKDVNTGYGFARTHPVLPYEILWILALSGIIGTATGVFAGRYLARLAEIPGALIFPFIIGLSIIGPYLVVPSFFSVVEVLVFGVIGLILRRLGYPLGAFVLAFVLGPTLESNMYLTHEVYPGVSFLWQDVAADVIVAIILVAVVVAVATSRQRRRLDTLRSTIGLGETTVGSEAADMTSGAGDSEGPVPSIDLAPAQYAVLSFVTTLALLAVSIYAAAYGISHYHVVTWLMPVFACGLIGVCSLIGLPGDTVRFARYVHGKWRLRRLARTPAGDITPAMLAEPGGAVLAASQGVSGTLVAASAAGRRQAQHRLEVVALGLIALAVVLVALIGFVLGLAVFGLAYGLVVARPLVRTWPRRAAYAAVTTVVLYFVAYELLQVTHLSFVPIFAV